MKADIMWLGSTDSTNDEAKRHISKIDNLSVLSALEQTAGRGQRGNQWHSTAGDNLLFSIVLKFSDKESLPSLQAKRHFILNEIASLSVVKFLSSHGIRAEIKWPNDIYVDDRKICGILIENSVRGSHLNSSIIGIGLNINQRNFNVNLPNPTSMVLCMPSVVSLDLRICLEEFMEIFISYYERFLTSDCDHSPLYREYLAALWRSGRPSRFIDYTTLPTGHLEGPMNIHTQSDSCPDITSLTNPPDQSVNEFPGIIRGLSSTGNLLVEDLTTGQIHEFGFKEIGYIL